MPRPPVLLELAHLGLLPFFPAFSGTCLSARFHCSTLQGHLPAELLQVKGGLNWQPLRASGGPQHLLILGSRSSACWDLEDGDGAAGVPGALPSAADSPPTPGLWRPHSLARLPGRLEGVGQVWFTLLLPAACSPLFLPLQPRSTPCCSVHLAQERDGGNGLRATSGPALDLRTPLALFSAAAGHVTWEPHAHGWLAGGTPCRFPFWCSGSTSTWHATHHDGPIPKTPAGAPGPAPDACPAPGVRWLVSPPSCSPALMVHVFGPVCCLMTMPGVWKGPGVCLEECVL